MVITRNQAKIALLETVFARIYEKMRLYAIT